MSVTIYGSIGSRASRCIWVAEELGIPYLWKSVSTLDGGNRRPEYLAINPSGKIPAMTDGEIVMTESMAINLYLAQQYGSGSLWPREAAMQAKALQWTFWSATEVEPYITDLYPQYLKPAPERDRALIERLIPAMLGKLAQLEAALGSRDYVLGPFTIADVNLAVQTFTCIDRFELTLDATPRVRAWTDRCRARPARQKVEALAAAAVAPK